MVVIPRTIPRTAAVPQPRAMQPSGLCDQQGCPPHDHEGIRAALVKIQAEVNAIQITIDDNSKRIAGIAINVQDNSETITKIGDTIVTIGDKVTEIGRRVGDVSVVIGQIGDRVTSLEKKRTCFVLRPRRK